MDRAVLDQAASIMLQIHGGLLVALALFAVYLRAKTKREDKGAA